MLDLFLFAFYFDWLATDMVCWDVLLACVLCTCIWCVLFVLGVLNAWFVLTLVVWLFMTETGLLLVNRVWEAWC